MTVANDTTEREWSEILKPYPPLLTPKQVQSASLGIIRVGDIYKRGNTDGKRIELDVRLIGGRVYVTKASLITALCGVKDREL